MAELGLSGRAGGTRLRGRIQAGLAEPSAIWLEGIAFGSPIFFLAGDAGGATLLLPRDERVLRGEPADAIIEAIAGVSLTPAELRAAIAGCGLGASTPTEGRTFGDDWSAVDTGSTVTYLKRVENQWRVAAAVRGPLTVLYDEFVRGRPQRLFIRTAGNGDPAADILLSVSQLEINAAVDPKAFVLNVPGHFQPISLEELRRAGPLGERR